MTLLNVRVGAEEARMAAALRQAGVTISALVREAIRAEYQRRVAPNAGGRRPSEIVLAILAAVPDPGDLAPRAFEAADRKAVRKHIKAKLSRTRP